MKNLKLTVKTASWFPIYCEELRKASLKAAEKGIPVDVVKNNFESAIRSAAYDAVEIGGFDGEESSKQAE